MDSPVYHVEQVAPKRFLVFERTDAGKAVVPVNEIDTGEAVVVCGVCKHREWGGMCRHELATLEHICALPDEVPDFKTGESVNEQAFLDALNRKPTAPDTLPRPLADCSPLSDEPDGYLPPQPAELPDKNAAPDPPTDWQPPEAEDDAA